jgi:hypothetical protein
MRATRSNPTVRSPLRYGFNKRYGHGLGNRRQVDFVCQKDLTIAKVERNRMMCDRHAIDRAHYMLGTSMPQWIDLKHSLLIFLDY